MKLAYSEERRAFSQFKAALASTPALRSDYERAIASVVQEYNTSIWENRFIAGGAVEMFTLWAMRAAGIGIVQVGAQLTGGDLQLPRGGRLSVKGVFTRAPREGLSDGRSTNLINTRGGGGNAVWSEATFFLIAGRGLYYADPELLPNKTTTSADAVSIRMRDVVEFGRSHPAYCADLNVAAKSDLTANSKVASEAVARETVTLLDLAELRRGFT